MEQSIIDQVESVAAGFNTVKPVADLTAVLRGGAGGRNKINIKNVPGAFIFYAGQAAAKAESQPGIFRQNLTERWGVMIVTRAVNDASGSKASTKTYELARQLDDALLGFVPTGGCDAMYKSGAAGRLIKWDTDYQFYACYYEVLTTFTKRTP